MRIILRWDFEIAQTVPAVASCGQSTPCVEGVSLERSLSVFLPVRNGQSTLERDVGRILEVLPELAARFDVLIIDDGSTDATAEVAHELSLRYPQVNFVSHPMPLGLPEAIQTGLDSTAGELVIVHDGQTPIMPAELPKLLRRFDVAPVARTANAARKSSWIGSLLTWLGATRAPERSQPAPSFYLMRRHTITEARRATANQRTTRARELLQVYDGGNPLKAEPAPYRWPDGLRPDGAQVQPTRSGNRRIVRSLRRFTLGE